MNYTEENISLILINQKDKSYKITSQGPDDSLRESIKTWGFLSRPLLLKINSNYVIVKGHNRIKAAEEAGYDELPCHVTGKLLIDDFLEITVKAFCDKKIGFFGTLKALSIMETLADNQDLMQKTASFFSIPWKLHNKNERINLLDVIPLNLQQYIDEKNMGYKAVSEVLLLTQQNIGKLSDLIRLLPLKMNNFKKIVDWLIDLQKREIKLDFNDFKKEDDAVQGIFQLRFPRYSSLKSRAQEIRKRLSQKNITVNYNESLETSIIDIIITLRSIDDLDSAMIKLGKLNREDLNELFEILS